MRTSRLLFCLLLFLLPAGCRAGREGGVHTLELVTGPLRLDGTYTSMLGPSEERRVTLEGGKRELLWIVGYEARLLSEHESSPVQNRFMCHVSVDLDKDLYQKQLGSRLEPAYRLVTLSQGITRVDFPDGFGMPIPSDQLLWVRSQVLNLNAEKLSDEVKFEIKLHYLRDAELKAPLKPLFLVRAPVVKAVDPAQSQFGGVASSAGCSVGVNANPDNYLEYDSRGQAFIPHWKVPPGREETKTLITERLALPEDMRVHTILTHVHPSAESLTLVDLSTMEMVYQARTRSATDRLEIESIDSYSSPEGILLKKDHQYGLVSVYDNKTDRDLDSMAVMYLYIHDPRYIPPTSAELATPLPPDTSLLKRDEKTVEWKSGSPFSLVNAFLGSNADWRLLGASETRSDWEGPSGKLAVESAGSGCSLTLAPIEKI